MKKIILLLLTITLLTGNMYAQKKKKGQKETDVQREAISKSSEQYENTAKFIEAVKERLNGNYAQAEMLLLEVIATEPSHDAAHYEYAKIHVEKRKYSAAVEELKIAIQLCDTNIWYKILLAETYDVISQFDLSEKIWCEITQKEPQNLEYLYQYTLSLIYQNKLKEALTQYNKIEVLSGVTEDISNAKKNIWIHYNKVDNAVKEIEKLAETFPFEVKYYLEIADLYVAKKMQDKAIPYLKKAEKIAPNHPQINIFLYNYYTENKKYDEAFQYLKKAFAAPELNIDEKIKILLGYYASPDLKDSTKAYQLLDNLMSTHSESPIAWSMYADFLIRDNRLDEAKTAYEKVISLDESKYPIWQRYLALLLELGKWDEANKQSYTAMSLFPAHAFPYVVRGIVASIKKEYADAVSVLEEGKKYAVEEADVLQINLFLAEAYSHLKEFEKSDKYYEILIKKYPQDAAILNNYSYSLSERDYRIEYALQLAKKTIELSPNTAIYEDTYAWAFFKNKDYQNARLWLEKALQHGGNKDYDILFHYSKVLEELGEITLSKEYKEKAEQLKQMSTNDVQ
ncbi:MAG: tetratricopeptide repeat protein [Bacteroidales bacterium]|jgi:tetratricopeptide (TPR) repeat protein|nr:tetratricopeptide repeat protein [Bacteroidales bacterium]